MNPGSKRYECHQYLYNLAVEKIETLKKDKKRRRRKEFIVTVNL